MLNGPLSRIAKSHARYLLDEIRPDRLLAPFLEQAGLAPRQERYRGWELSSLAGHSLGHYLSAVSLLYASTRNAKAKQRAEYMVAELARCQNANGDGYVMPMPKAGFVDLSAGKIDVQPFMLNGLWAPYYVVHKVLAGLREAYRHANIAQAAAVAEPLAGFFIRQVERLDDAQVRQMLICEHGGIYEILLDWCDLLRRLDWLPVVRRAFYDAASLDPLTAREDRLNGKHCNTLIPKVLGLAKNHELSGDPGAAAAAEFFFRRVTTFRSFVNGSFGDSEHFFPIGREAKHLTPWTGEGCNTYNLLKLAGRLFQWRARSGIIDYVERTLINHVAANIGRRGGEFGYFLGLGSLGHKVFSPPQQGWWCCVGTGMENPARYGEMIYSTLPDGIAVNLYFASRLKAEKWGLTLTNRSQFPLGEEAFFTLSLKTAACLTLAFRKPAWCDRMTVAVNGAPATPELRNGYFILNRRWQDGDAINIAMPFVLKAVPLRGNKNIAITYGPLLLSGIVPLPKDQINEAKVRMEGHLDARGKMDGIPPVIATGSTETFLKSLVPLRPFGWFRSRDMIKPHDLTFKPFISVYEEYYVVYFPVMTAESWRRRKRRFALVAERQRLNRLRRLDEVHPGFQQSEVEHRFAGEKTDTGESLFRKWRRAQPGGYFSYTLKCAPGLPLELIVTTYGGEWADHQATILLDGVKIAELHPDNSQPGEWVNTGFPVPADLLAGKSHGEFRFAASSELDTGRIFGIELRKTAPPPQLHSQEQTG
ncbi:MAG: beta-L-arabinofuranosidase domain-containing protein [Lentisphaeria bacterium]